jgi:tetratricopeptide (TPR) repeat protein
MRVERLLVMVVIAAALAGRAEAAPADNPAAKAAFTEGERSFQLGKFDAAIDAYERAFGLDPQPAFLFNIALSHRRQYEIDGRIDHLARARELYRNYLKLEPQTVHKAGVEKLIAELTEKIDLARVTQDPPPPVAAPAASSISAMGVTPAAAPPAPAPSTTAAVLSAPAETVEAPPSSRRRWVIGGTIAAAAVVAAIAIFFAMRSNPSFDGPGVNVTNMH